MLRGLCVAAALLLLGACESFGDLTSDAFDPGNAPQGQFTTDSARCAEAAEGPRSYDIRGIAGTHVERHEIFNRAYTACMRRLGYVRRDWSPDLAVPYAINPFPG